MCERLPSTKILATSTAAAALVNAATYQNTTVPDTVSITTVVNLLNRLIFILLISRDVAIKEVIILRGRHRSRGEDMNRLNRLLLLGIHALATALNRADRIELY
jgi:hypothetical protein